MKHMPKLELFHVKHIIFRHFHLLYTAYFRVFYRFVFSAVDLQCFDPQFPVDNTNFALFLPTSHLSMCFFFHTTTSSSSSHRLCVCHFEPFRAVLRRFEVDFDQIIVCIDCICFIAALGRYLYKGALTRLVCVTAIWAQRIRIMQRAYVYAHRHCALLVRQMARQGA